MKRIVYYISDHGYGHATRGIGLIRELAKNTDLQIIIKTGRPLSFIKQSLAEFSNIKYIYSQNDVGLILEKDSLEVDQQALYKAVMDWVDNWDELVAAEVSFLKENQLDLVISDITPWPFLAAEKAGVKSIAISNFTWYEMYHEFFPKAVFNKRIEDAYLRAGLLLCLPLCNKLDLFKRIENVSLMVRKTNYKQANEIRDRIGRDKKLIYIGLGKSVNLDYLKKIKFSQYREFNFLFSAGTEVVGDNIFTIPKDDLETQNYIAACDYIITKAGWSTIAEAIQAHIPLLIIKRDNIIEDRIMIREIERLKIGRAIDINEFEELKIRDYLMKLDELKVNYQYLDNRFKNNSYQIAKQIWQLI